MTPSRLLIVDDEPAISGLLQEAAESAGWEAAVAVTPEAFRRGLQQPFDVLVMDLMLPGTDGVELLREVAARRTPARIILASGVDRRVLESAQRVAVELGLNVLGALNKPFRIAEFLALLNGQPSVPLAPDADVQFPVSVADLHQAAQGGEWVLHYQPQVEFATGQTVGVEALVRWQHAQHGLLYPDRFIAQAEAAGLIGVITQAAVERGLRDLAHWHARGFPLRLAVNISACSLNDLDWPDRLQREVASIGLAPDCLTLEVTETGLMRDFAKSLDILTRLRIKGFQLSIDDFGTGYSSMQQVMRVPATELKIDRSFVAHLVDSKDAEVIVDQTIALAHQLGLRVVAEGVETAAAWDRLARAGCDLAQGYLIGRPVSAQQLTHWLEAGTWGALSPPLAPGLPLESNRGD